MRRPNPNAATLLAGLCWGAGLGVAAGGPLLIAGAFAFAAVPTGQPRQDTLRGYAVGLITSGLWFIELPQIWSTYGQGPGLLLYASLVLLQASPFAVASAVVGHLDSGERWLATGAALCAVTLLTAQLPVPIDLSVLAAFAPPLLWPAALAGTAGLTFAAGLTGGALLERPRLGLALLILWIGGGLVWQAAPGAEPDLRVTLIQPNFGPFESRRSSTADARKRELLRLVDTAEGIALTPETAWPGSTPPQVPIPAVIGHAGPAKTNRLTGTTAFDKKSLVPLVERSWLGFGEDTFAAGRGVRWLTTGEAGFAPLICFEDLLQGALSEAASAPAGPLLLATNDGWLSIGRAADKHLAVSVLAAVRTGRWAARPATSGPSAVISPRGGLVVRTEAVDGDSTESGVAIPALLGREAPMIAGVQLEPLVGGFAGLILLLRIWRP